MSRESKSPQVRTTLTIIVAAGLLAGCKAGGSGKPVAAKPGSEAPAAAAAIIDPNAPAKPEVRYKVTTDQAPFFRFSPQQAAGADKQLKKDTRVTFLSRLAGYSKVQLPGGDYGYVDTGDITHLDPKEIADEDALYAAQHAPPAALAPLNGAGNLGNIGNGGNYNPPPEAGQAQPLPVPDPVAAPTPPPASIFRY